MCEQIVCYVTLDSGSDKPSAAEILKWMKDLNDWFSVGEKVCSVAVFYCFTDTNMQETRQ